MKRRNNKNQKLNEALGEKDAIISNAEGEKAARIEQARDDVAIFNKLYGEYKNNPEITRERLIIETLEQVLPGSQVYIMNDDGSTLKYLPIEPQKNESTIPAPIEGGDSDE